jgi:hypothetical protein
MARSAMPGREFVSNGSVFTVVLPGVKSASA